MAQKLTFKATTLKLKFVDADGDGRQDAGDSVIFSEQFTNLSGRTVKGVDTVRCTLNVAGHGVHLVQCDGEFVLARGGASSPDWPHPWWESPAGPAGSRVRAGRPA